MSCSFCSPMKRKKEFMSEDTFRKILSDIKPYTDYIYFHVKGEPLMHPLIGTFLDISAEMGFNVNLTTNATLIREKQHLLLGKNALRQVNISLHSFENGTDAEFMQYMHDIIEFAKAARRDTFIVMRLWNLKNTQNPENLKIIKLLEENFAPDNDVVSMIERAPVNKLSERSLTLAQNVYLSQEKVFKWPDINDPVIGSAGFCYGLRTMSAILVDGTVVPCCLDADGSAPLGNIHCESFGDIIASPTATAINDGFSCRKAVHPLCRRCSYRARFNRKKKIYSPIDR